MNIHIISCQVFYREISYFAALSDCTTSVSWLPQGLHDTPNLLRERVQQEIDKIESELEAGLLKQNPDVILLGYGLCSNGVVGLTSRILPLVVPRTDDCIAVFLGSQRRYLEIFREYPGSYWLNSGWLESAFLPTKENYDKMYRDYCEIYGEDNAAFLMEHEVSWIKNYTTCNFIHSPVYQNAEKCRQAQQIAAHNNWEFQELPGDSGMFERLLGGIFSDDEVLVCPPGHRIEASFDETKLRASV